ncbi:MAG: hypothetical protein HY726_09270 [Candidatus Rokubacteria bacterium]|nr:hypothetical protein [Candidatus Rokubacteria bacterium]
MRYSRNFLEQGQAAFVEMVQALVKRGCKTNLAYAYAKEEEPGVIVLGVRCLDWAEQAAQ